MFSKLVQIIEHNQTQRALVQGQALVLSLNLNLLLVVLVNFQYHALHGKVVFPSLVDLLVIFHMSFQLVEVAEGLLAKLALEVLLDVVDLG